MKYGIFTTSEEKFRAQCQEIFDSHPHYKGYRSLPMLQWTKNRIVLRDGTDIHWINPKNLDSQMCGVRLQRIYVLDGISEADLLEYIYPSFFCGLKELS